MDLFIRITADTTLVVLVIVSALIVLSALRKHWWTNAPVLIMAGLTSLLAGKVLSLVYQPAIARPFIELGVSPGASYIDNPGFPSDHALLATVLVVAVWAVTRNHMLGIALSVLVIVMGVGRVLAYVHTPLDILGGVFAGLLGLIWYKKLTKS